MCVGSLRVYCCAADQVSEQIYLTKMKKEGATLESFYEINLAPLVKNL